ncbi:hypothetical protein PIB30_093023, partial [Stylosanthes scabra]|nr:hypothetical protein [Stylosanthes scabra]
PLLSAHRRYHHAAEAVTCAAATASSSSSSSSSFHVRAATATATAPLFLLRRKNPLGRSHCKEAATTCIADASFSLRDLATATALLAVVVVVVLLLYYVLDVLARKV